MTETKIITVTLDLPPRELHPNGGSRHSHHKIARLIKLYRDYACLEALAAGMPSKPWPGATHTMTFYFKSRSNRGRDGDNLVSWLKNGRDGIIDAGLLTDDKFLKIFGEPIQKIDPTHPRVELMFTRTGDSP